MQGFRIVAIGASAGGVEVVSEILGGLKPTCQVAILLVIHIPPTRDTRLLQLLRSKSRLPVIEVDDKEQILRSHVYLAPPDYHILVEDEESLALSSDLPINYSRPSIDVLFESAADVFGERLIGVVLTGANRDGASGLSKIISARGIGIVQDPEEAHCRVMPEAAISNSASALVMSRSQIIEFLNERT